MTAQFSSDSSVLAPMCGMAMTWGWFSKSGSGKSQTYLPSLPASKLRLTAAESTIVSRAKFSSTAPGLVSARAASLIRWLGGVHGGDVQRDVVRPRQQRLQVFHAGDFAGQAPSGVNRQRGVKPHHLHAHGQRHVGDHGANRPQPDNAQRLAFDLAAGKAGFFFFQMGGHLGRIGHGGQGVDIGHARQNAARRQQHAGHHQFFDRIGVRARGVENDDAQLAVLGNRHVVDTSAGAGGGQQRFGDFHALQLLAAQQKRIGVADVAAHLVGLAREAFQSFD